MTVLLLTSPYQYHHPKTFSGKGAGYAPLGVLSVGNRVTNDVLEEDLENTTSLFVNETGDTLHTTTTGETTDSGLGDTYTQRREGREQKAEGQYELQVG